MSLLEEVGILEVLTDAELEHLRLFCQEKQLTTWEVLFRDGDEANSMYILKRGKMAVSRFINGVDIHLWYVSAEEILWEIALFSSSTNRMATARAVEDCTLVVILAFSIKEMTRKHPDLMVKIQGIIKNRLIDNKVAADKHIWS